MNFQTDLSSTPRTLRLSFVESDCRPTSLELGLKSPSVVYPAVESRQPLGHLSITTEAEAGESTFRGVATAYLRATLQTSLLYSAGIPTISASSLAHSIPKKHSWFLATTCHVAYDSNILLKLCCNFYLSTLKGMCLQGLSIHHTRRLFPHYSFFCSTVTHFIKLPETHFKPYQITTYWVKFPCLR